MNSASDAVIPVVDTHFEHLIPALSEVERQALEANVVRDGCLDPISVWKDKGRLVVLDGHHRLEICRRRRIPYETVAVEVEGRDAAMAWAIEHQLGRRNLPPFARIELALKLEPLLKEQAKKRMQSGRADPMQNSSGGPVRQQVAAQADTSHDSVRKAKTILAQGGWETIKALRSGETTINAAFKEVEHLAECKTANLPSPSTERAEKAPIPKSVNRVAKRAATSLSKKLGKGVDDIEELFADWNSIDPKHREAITSVLAILVERIAGLRDQIAAMETREGVAR